MEKSYENWQTTKPCSDAFCCFPTALLKSCISQGIPSPQNKPLGACWGFSAVPCSQTSYHCCWPIQVKLWLICKENIKKEWLLYLKVRGNVNHTGFYYEIDTWWALTCHQTISNFNFNLNHAHILFISEEKKMPSERLQSPEQFPLVLGSVLLLQSRATTVVTKSLWGSRNFYL